jgi:hypothetical protein
VAVRSRWSTATFTSATFWRPSASHGSTDLEALVGEPAFDGGHLLGDAVGCDATTDRVERVTVQTADGLGVSLDRPSS